MITITDFHMCLNGLIVPILGMIMPNFIGNPYNGYINPYYWVDDHQVTIWR